MMWAIYFLGIVDKFAHVFGSVALVSCVVVGGVSMGFIPMLVEGASDSTWRVMKKAVKYLAIICCVTSLLWAALPSTKTVAAMYIVPAIVNNEQIQGIAGNSLKALEKLTQKWLKDLAEEAEHI